MLAFNYIITQFLLAPWPLRKHYLVYILWQHQAGHLICCKYEINNFFLNADNQSKYSFVVHFKWESSNIFLMYHHLEHFLNYALDLPQWPCVLLPKSLNGKFMENPLIPNFTTTFSAAISRNKFRVVVVTLTPLRSYGRRNFEFAFQTL